VIWYRLRKARFSRKMGSGEDRFIFALNEILFKFGRLKSLKSRKSSLGHETIRLSRILK